MLFSIIIAAYNVESFIRQAIDSCLNQTGIDKDEYELIVIDDGAKDNTPSIIDEYKGLPNVNIVHKENGGLSNTRNRGVELAKGDFVLFLDGDDWLKPEALSLLKTKTTIADLIVFPMTYWYPQKGEVVKSFGLREGVVFGKKVFLKETLGRQKLNIIPAPCKCYRRSILTEHNQHFVEGILHEDNPFFAETAKNFDKITYIESGIYVYRQQREGSITNSHTLRNFRGVVEGNKHILDVWGFSNRYINYMVSSASVFQVILEYNNPADADVVMRHYRGAKEKWIALKQIVRFPLIPNAMVRNILLIIDPMLLLKVIKCIKYIRRISR